MVNKPEPEPTTDPTKKKNVANPKAPPKPEDTLKPTNRFSGHHDKEELAKYPTVISLFFLFYIFLA